MTKREAQDFVLTSMKRTLEICRKDTAEAMAQSERVMAQAYELLSGTRAIIDRSGEE